MEEEKEEERKMQRGDAADEREREEAEIRK